MNSFEEQENPPEPSEATRAVRRLIQGLSATVYPQPAVTAEQPHKCRSDAGATDARLPLHLSSEAVASCKLGLGRICICC